MPVPHLECVLRPQRRIGSTYATSSMRWKRPQFPAKPASERCGARIGMCRMTHWLRLANPKAQGARNGSWAGDHHRPLFFVRLLMPLGRVFPPGKPRLILIVSPGSDDRSKVAVSPGSAWSEEGLIVPRTVAFLNKKGGVGKTSTVHHLGGTLARRGLGAPGRRRPAGQPDPGAARARGRRGPRPPRRRSPRSSTSPAPSAARPGAADAASPNLSLLAGLRGRASEYNDPDPWDCGPAPVRAPGRPGRGRATGSTSC